MRNTITRTFTTNSVKALVYVNGKVIEESALFPSTVNNIALAEKYARKHDMFTGKLVEVISIKKVEALFGMDETDFISHAKAVTERSKETRGMISKTVAGNMGTLLYMDSDRKVKEMPVYIPKGAKLDKLARSSAPEGCKGIDIINIKETETLYVMSSEDFIKYARPMKDHQHYYAE